MQSRNASHAMQPILFFSEDLKIYMFFAWFLQYLVTFPVITVLEYLSLQSRIRSLNGETILVVMYSFEEQEELDEQFVKKPSLLCEHEVFPW